MTRDERYMTLALEQARAALTAGEVPVGAVIVLGETVLASAHNLRETDCNPLAHAETEAIKKAALAVRDWRLSGCEMFVTLEPCAMCSGAVVESRVRRLVFGAFDPERGFMGSVADLTALVSSSGPEILGGVLQLECEKLLKSFFKRKRQV